MKISAVVCTFNEETNMAPLIKSLKDCDEIIIDDDHSTDKTREIAKKMGAKVFLREDKSENPIQKDIDNFIRKFGYKPSFTTKDVIRSMAEIRNKAMSYAKNDWVFFPDADEIVSWDFKEIERLQTMFDHIECELIQTRDSKGNPISYNNITKLFRRSLSRWEGINHEVIVGMGKIRLIHASRMKINHYQLQKERRRDALIKNLEFSISRNNNPRDMLYLGREFFWMLEFEKAIKMFDFDIKYTNWLPEMAESFFFKALCLQRLGKIDEAQTTILGAISINPNMRKAFILMSELTNPTYKQEWLQYALSANNRGVVFP